MHIYIYLHVMHVHSCFCVCKPDKRDYDPQLLMIQWCRPSSNVWFTCIKRIHNDEWSQSTYWVWPRRMYSILFPERIIVMWLSSRIVRFWCSISGMALSERIGSPKSNASCLFLRIQRSVWVHLGNSCPIFSHNHLMFNTFPTLKKPECFEEDQFQSRCQADCFRRRESAQRSGVLAAESSNLRGTQWLDPYTYPVF